jgi:O-antigen/teichoic acid export membrane protein
MQLEPKLTTNPLETAFNLGIQAELENAAPTLQHEVTDKQTKLDRSLIRGLAWTGGMKWAIQIVAWASTLAVARILSPADYGVVMLATVYLGVLTLVSDFGVSTAVVALRDLTDEQLAQLNGLAVLVGISGFGVSFLIARPAGRFFSAPRLPAVLIVMSVSFIISSFQSVPSSLLRKELRFKLLSVIDGARGLAIAGLVLALAIAGFRYWALVIGAVATTAINTALILTQRRHRFAWPRWRDLKRQIRFSSHVSTVSLGWYWYSNADFVVAGRMLGQAALGTYSLAWQLANTPLEKVTSVIGSVTPAYFSAVQDDRSALKRYLLKPTEAISFVLFPAMIGMALVASDAVPLVLGAKWHGLAAPLELLALYATYRSVMPLMPQVLVVSGETRFLMWNTVVSAVLIPTAFVFGSRWGTSGIAAAWVMAYPINALPIYLRTARRLRMRFTEYWRALSPAVSGSAAMAAVVWFVEWMIPATALPVSRLLAEVASGAAAYIGFQLVFHRDRVTAFYHSGKMLRAGAPSENV